MLVQAPNVDMVAVCHVATSATVCWARPGVHTCEIVLVPRDRMRYTPGAAPMAGRMRCSTTSAYPCDIVMRTDSGAAVGIPLCPYDERLVRYVCSAPSAIAYAS